MTINPIVFLSLSHAHTHAHTHITSHNILIKFLSKNYQIMTSHLLSPFSSGQSADPINLSHRIVLAPLTRNRATEPSLCVHAAHAE